jgi:hypothetical protein
MEKQKVRIACIGNMNNFMFSVVRNLRELNYDAHLFLLDEFEHFLPLGDSYSTELPNYVHQLDWYNIGVWAITKEKIKKDLEGYNFFIGTDLIPAFFEKAKIKLDIFTPHGGDIYHHCYYKFKNFPPKRYEIGAWWRSRQQRAGARNASCIMYDKTTPDFEKHSDKLRLQSNRLYVNAPYIFPAQYNEQNFSETAEYKPSRLIREKYDLIFFHHSRHVWKTHIDTLHFKANDKIIKAYAEFVNQNIEYKSLLIMFEYGWDIKASKQLVLELGISEKVLWLPLMERKNVMVWLSIADMGIGEVGNSWLSYGSAYEVLCLRKPFLGYRKDEDFSSYFPDLYPMVSANTLELILYAFNDLKNNPIKYKEMGQKGHEWFMKYAIERPVNEIVKQIEAKSL